MKFKSTIPSSSTHTHDERIKEFIVGAKENSVSGDNIKNLEKVKMVRDGFSMPLDDYKLLDQARRKALSLGLVDIEGVSKSQILRIALRYLTKIKDEDFIILFNETKTR